MKAIGLLDLMDEMGTNKIPIMRGGIPWNSMAAVEVGKKFFFSKTLLEGSAQSAFSLHVKHTHTHKHTQTRTDKHTHTQPLVNTSANK